MIDQINTGRPNDLLETGGELAKRTTTALLTARRAVGMGVLSAQKHRVTGVFRTRGMDFRHMNMPRGQKKLPDQNEEAKNHNPRVNGGSQGQKWGARLGQAHFFYGRE